MATTPTPTTATKAAADAVVRRTLFGELDDFRQMGFCIPPHSELAAMSTDDLVTEVLRHRRGADQIKATAVVRQGATALVQVADAFGLFDALDREADRAVNNRDLTAVEAAGVAANARAGAEGLVGTVGQMLMADALRLPWDPTRRPASDTGSPPS